MNVAIMQPYFFPYMGYFDLIAQSDVFVLLNDVQYIRRGWINRNKICIKKPFFITVPIKNANQNTKINKILISKDFNWVQKHKNSFRCVYGNKAIQSSLYEYYSSFFMFDYLQDLLTNSLIWVSKTLGLKTEFILSSELQDTNQYKGQKRIIEICKKLKAKKYLNLPGGKNLYNLKDFKHNNIKLEFLNTDHHNKISVLENLFIL